MKITKRQLRRLINEELSSELSRISEGEASDENPPDTADEMMDWLVTRGGYDPNSLTATIIKVWVNKQYDNPKGFPIEVWNILKPLGENAANTLIDYIKSFY